MIISLYAGGMTIRYIQAHLERTLGASSSWWSGLTSKGFDVQIYDPIVNPERLVSSNLRYIESRLPEPAPAARCDSGCALQGSDGALVSTSDRTVIDELRASPPKWILDLHGRLGAEIERLLVTRALAGSMTQAGPPRRVTPSALTHLVRPAWALRDPRPREPWSSGERSGRAINPRDPVPDQVCAPGCQGDDRYRDAKPGERVGGIMHAVGDKGPTHH
jgi:hypothetical protein